MITIDRTQCLWCGTCVGVCPNYAITLYETRIEFDDRCVECGLCVRVQSTDKSLQDWSFELEKMFSSKPFDYVKAKK